ncbi:MAG: glycerophosphodiester phosphodiesterase family protein [Janthinobacterium lividum]
MLLLSNEASARTLTASLRSAPIVCAHRGWTTPDQPENSLRIMRDTETHGRFMLEMDLGLTRDGTIAMMHDATIDRTTDGHGRLSDLSDQELKDRHLRTAAGTVTTDRLPLLSDVLAWSRADPRPLLMLDIKQTPPKQVMVLVRRYRMTSRVLLLTFDPALARAAFAADPNVLVSVLVKSNGDLDLYRSMAAGRRFAAYIPRDLPAGLFQRAHVMKAVVIADMLNNRDAFADTIDPHAVQRDLPMRADYRQVLKREPIDILVTNHPTMVVDAIRSQ